MTVENRDSSLTSAQRSYDSGRKPSVALALKIKREETDMGDSSLLLRPLTEDEAILLTTIHEQYRVEGRFPVFDLVERTL